MGSNSDWNELTDWESNILEIQAQLIQSSGEWGTHLESTILIYRVDYTHLESTKIWDHASSRLSSCWLGCVYECISQSGQESQMCRVGQSHIYTVNIGYSRQIHHQTYSHKRSIHTVLANPTDFVWLLLFHVSHSRVIRPWSIVYIRMCMRVSKHTCVCWCVRGNVHANWQFLTFAFKACACFFASLRASSICTTFELRFGSGYVCIL